MYVVSSGEGRIAEAIGRLRSKLPLEIRSGRVMCHQKVEGRWVPAHAAGSHMNCVLTEAYQEPPYTQMLIVSRDGHRHRWITCPGNDPITEYPLESWYTMPWWQRS